MKIAFFLIVLILFSVVINAQCDSLKEASNSQSGTQQVDALVLYCAEGDNICLLGIKIDG